MVIRGRSGSRQERPWGSGAPRILLGGSVGLLGALALSCSGEITGPGTTNDPNNMNPGIVDDNNDGVDDMTGLPTGNDDDPAMPSNLDPGSKATHRLNDKEYNYTIQDLFEDPTLEYARGWLPAESNGFDNIAEVLHVNDGQYEKYFLAATDIANKVFARPDQVTKLVTCAQGAGCADTLVDNMSVKVWRRPALDFEKVSMVGVYDRAVALGLDHTAASKELLKAFLVSPEFLYRIELDADPVSPTAHAITPYELASRLSYFLWSSTPDETLLGEAQAGTLQQPATLEAAVRRMLDSDKS